MYKKLFDIVDSWRLRIDWIWVDKNDVFGALFELFDSFELTDLLDLVSLFYFTKMVIWIACMQDQ